MPERLRTTAAEGRAAVLRAVKESAGLQLWHGDHLLATLLGRADAPSERTWTLEELQSVLDEHRLPVWVLRPVDEPGGPRHVIWANQAATKHFGRPCTSAEVLQFFQRLPPARLDVAKGFFQQLHQSVQVEQKQLSANINLSRLLGPEWTAMPQCLFGRVRKQAIRVMVDGQPQLCYLDCLEKELSVEKLRHKAVLTRCTLHSFMFNTCGLLLFSSAAATLKLHAAGVTDLTEFLLADLLMLNGQPQTKLAEEALDLLCGQRVPHHTVTLSTPHADGKMRHTMYEMWQSEDPVDIFEPVVIVSAIDVTPQKETELELQSLKQQLQQRNSILQHEVEESAAKQAALEAQLQTALQLRRRPRTQLDTSSPVDRTIDLLDDLLVGRSPSLNSVMSCKRMLLHSPNLRHMIDLESQLQQSDMPADVSRSLVDLLQEDHSSTRRLAAELTSPTATYDHDHRRLEQSKSMHLRLLSRKDLGTADLHRHRLRRMSTSLRCSITPDIDRLLQDARLNWDFDMGKLDVATRGHSLSCYGFWLLQQTGLMERCHIPEEQLALSLKALEKGYSDANPYHNRLHAASVLHMASNLVRYPDGLLDCNIMEDTLELSLYLSAICHDFDHPGLNNDFLIKTHASLAMCYNDKSPLENHHAAGAFRELYKFLDLTNKKVAATFDQTMRTSIIELILATDMKQHFSLISRFKGACRAGDYAAAAARASSLPDCQQPLTSQQCLLAAQMAIKAADLGHLAQPTHLHRDQVHRLQEEFFRQGDRERAAGLPISALMDRENPAEMSGSQVGFFEIVALPLFRSLVELAPGAQAMLDAATSNYHIWRGVSSDGGVT